MGDRMSQIFRRALAAGMEGQNTDMEQTTIKMLFKVGVTGAAIFWMCGCANSAADSQAQPNFIVQEVQTGTRVGEEQNATSDEEKSNPQKAPNALDEKDKVIDDVFDGNMGILDGDEDKQDWDMADGSMDESASVSIPPDKEDCPPKTEFNNGNDSEKVTIMSVAEMDLLQAHSAVDISVMTPEEVACCFYFEEVPDIVFERMEGKSFSEDCTVPLSELRYVRVLHYGFDGCVYIGELVVNKGIAQDAVDIFRELFDAEYQIEKMVLIDDYDANDNRSMADNNTSCFNYRMVEGTSSLSLHAYGLAIDINPLYNPYLPKQDEVVVLPENASEYVDRSIECEYYIRHGDICYKAFADRGFSWGGDWKASKDYQHFSKTFD